MFALALSAWKKKFRTEYRWKWEEKSKVKEKHTERNKARNRETTREQSTAHHGWPWRWGDACMQTLEPMLVWYTSLSMRIVQEKNDVWGVSVYSGRTVAPLPCSWMKVFVTHSGVCAVVWLWAIHSLPGEPGTRILWMSCWDPRVWPRLQDETRSNRQPCWCLVGPKCSSVVVASLWSLVFSCTRVLNSSSFFK